MYDWVIRSVRDCEKYHMNGAKDLVSITECFSGLFNVISMLDKYTIDAIIFFALVGLLDKIAEFIFRFLEPRIFHST